MPATNLLQLSETVYYLPGGVNAALVVGPDNEAVFVDTGGDKEYGRRLRKACEALGAKPGAILNTHAHADHYGGNDYLVRTLGLPVYAPPFEAGIMQYPLLEPVYLFGGANPPPELRSKWLLAKASPVHHLLAPGPFELFGIDFEVIESSGHAHTHYAVAVGDVVLAADSLFGVAALDKYPLPFGQDIERQVASAKRMGEHGARVLLPGHGQPTEDAAGLAARNVATFDTAARAVAEACRGSDTAEVLRETCRTLGIEIGDVARYYLDQCTVMAYLSYLRNEGRVDMRLRNNSLCWFQKA